MGEALQRRVRRVHAEPDKVGASSSEVGEGQQLDIIGTTAVVGLLNVVSVIKEALVCGEGEKRTRG